MTFTINNLLSLEKNAIIVMAENYANCEFSNHGAKPACFSQGHLYYFNKNYTSKNGAVTDYYHCVNK